MLTSVSSLDNCNVKEGKKQKEDTEELSIQLSQNNWYLTCFPTTNN